MRRYWKHAVGFVLCGVAVMLVYGVAGVLSLAALSPDGPPSEHSRQVSSLGHEMQDVFLSPTRWLFDESGVGAFVSWAIWSALIFLLCYCLVRLIYGVRRKPMA
jgi:4-amino-4-deoxy-L-arabinose transferase-like glycosyltransferase